jgi:hypothetical protein
MEEGREDALRQMISQLFSDLRNAERKLAEYQAGLDPERDRLEEELAQLREENTALSVAMGLYQSDKTIDLEMVFDADPVLNESLNATEN